jgi:hypothetical protein
VDLALAADALGMPQEDWSCFSTHGDVKFRQGQHESVAVVAHHDALALDGRFTALVFGKDGGHDADSHLACAPAVEAGEYGREQHAAALKGSQGRL